MKNILVLATRNKGKTREIREILKNFPIEIKNLDDFGPIPEIEEDGTTFEENAYKKASFASRILGYPAIADDSGLVVEALDGKPGVISARYAGIGAADDENMQKLLKELKDIEKSNYSEENINNLEKDKADSDKADNKNVIEKNRKAAFECVISIAVPTGAALTYEGRCEGVIIDEPRGEDGFGYDPIFLYPELGKTFAELSIQEKSMISHRGLALKEIVSEFDKILEWIDINMPRFKVECKSECF